MTCFEARFLASLEADEGDVTVTLNDESQLRAESCILAICSPVLRATLRGPMIEAQELRITMDADAATAKEFLRFLYIGRLYSDAPSLELVVDLLRLADYYGVKDEFVKIVEGSSFDSVVIAAAGAMDDPTVLVVKLLPFLKESHKTQQLLFAHLKLALGRNVYKCICHALAYGLDELLEHCRQAPVLNPFVLEKEINEDIVRALLCVHHPLAPGPAITSQAVQQFISICAQRRLRWEKEVEINEKMVFPPCSAPLLPGAAVPYCGPINDPPFRVVVIDWWQPLKLMVHAQEAASASTLHEGEDAETHAPQEPAAM